MIKHVTELRSFDDLKPGDIIASHHNMRFVCLAWIAAGCVRVILRGSHGETDHFTCHESNWPEVVTGFTPEYQAAYPHEVFS